MYLMNSFKRLKKANKGPWNVNNGVTRLGRKLTQFTGGHSIAGECVGGYRNNPENSILL
jgi:hypothetical protein